MMKYLDKTLEKHTPTEQLRMLVIYYNIVARRRRINLGLCTTLGLVAMTPPFLLAHFYYKGTNPVNMDIPLAFSAIATFFLGKIIIRDIRTSRLLSKLLKRICPEFDKMTNDQIQQYAPGKPLLDAYHKSCAAVR